MKKLHKRIKKRRRELGISQSLLSEIVGATQPEISRFEKGDSNITLNTLYRYCKALKLKIIIRKV